jgi:hypothetical protein
MADEKEEGSNRETEKRPRDEETQPESGNDGEMNSGNRVVLIELCLSCFSCQTVHLEFLLLHPF